MKVRSPRVTVAIVGAGLMILGFVGTSVLAKPAIPYDNDITRTVSVTKQQAIDAVRGRINGKAEGALRAATAASAIRSDDLVAADPEDGAYFRYIEVTGQDVEAAVDAKSGRVVQVYFPHRIPTQSGTVMTPAAAKQAAEAYLDGQGISTAGLDATVYLNDNGAGKSYEITWRHQVNGAYVPDERVVKLDASTGSVFVVNDLERTYEAPPAPVVDAAAAVAISTAFVENGRESASTTVVNTEERVVFTPDGVQQLVWWVSIELTDSNPYTSYFLVQVNAATGEAAVIGQG